MANKNLQLLLLTGKVAMCTMDYGLGGQKLKISIKSYGLFSPCYMAYGLEVQKCPKLDYLYSFVVYNQYRLSLTQDLVITKWPCLATLMLFIPKRYDPV